MILRALLCTLAIAISACASRPGQLVVVVHSDLVVGTQLDALEIRVLDAAMRPVSTRHITLGTRPGDAMIPGSFGIAPVGGDTSRRIVLEIDAVNHGCTLFTYRAVTGFLAGRRLRLDVFLSQQCAPTTATCVAADVCHDPNLTCGAGGQCVSVSMPPESLPDDTDGGVPDAQTPPADAATDLAVDVPVPPSDIVVPMDTGNGRDAGSPDVSIADAAGADADAFGNGPTGTFGAIQPTMSSPPSGAAIAGNFNWTSTPPDSVVMMGPCSVQRWTTPGTHASPGVAGGSMHVSSNRAATVTASPMPNPPGGAIGYSQNVSNSLWIDGNDTLMFAVDSLPDGGPPVAMNVRGAARAFINSPAFAPPGSQSFDGASPLLVIWSWSGGTTAPPDFIFTLDDTADPSTSRLSVVCAASAGAGQLTIPSGVLALFRGVGGRYAAMTTTSTEQFAAGWHVGFVTQYFAANMNGDVVIGTFTVR